MMLEGVKNNQFRTLVEILFLRLSRRFYVSMSHRCLCQCCQRLLFGTPTTSLMDEVGVDAKQSKNIGQIYVCIYIYISIYLSAKHQVGVCLETSATNSGWLPPGVLFPFVSRWFSHPSQRSKPAHRETWCKLEKKYGWIDWGEKGIGY